MIRRFTFINYRADHLDRPFKMGEANLCFTKIFEPQLIADNGAFHAMDCCLKPDTELRHFANLGTLRSGSDFSAEQHAYRRNN